MCATRRCSTADSVKVVSAQKRTQSRTSLSPRLVFSETSIWVSPIKGNLKFRAIFLKNSVKVTTAWAWAAVFYFIYKKRQDNFLWFQNYWNVCPYGTRCVCFKVKIARFIWAIVGMNSKLQITAGFPL